ncbi:response regulator [Planktosalinus lacus]|uniref:Response regulator n=1 Tax=Planktosalinus lacus TaxID=1526573 RepID=A0A8J2Y6P4_9FLAO|nr:response regulator [Planktosalinus lacus]GGD92474.1 response regulator [Planktosalinus lacus]
MSRTICIIDDDPLYKLLLKKTIERLNMNINILTFEDGKQAIEGLSTLNTEAAKLPDIILLDINMPVMDGWEFMDQFVEDKSQFSKPMNIFIASSSIAKHDIEKSKTYTEISGYLVKPIVKKTILELLQDKVSL